MNEKITKIEDISNALDKIDEREGLNSGKPDDAVLIRGGMASIKEGYRVPAHHNYDDEESNLDDSNPFSDVDLGIGNPYPPNILDLETILDHGTEKGVDADQTRVAVYTGSRKDNVGLSHLWEAVNNVPWHLKNGNVSVENQAQTRPIIMKYNSNVVGEKNGYRVELPEEDELRAEAIEYVLVIDEDPTDEDYDIGKL